MKTFEKFVGALATLLAIVVVLVALGACCREPHGQLMPIQCPESARTYCPAQHDTTKARHFPGDTAGAR